MAGPTHLQCLIVHEPEPFDHLLADERTQLEAFLDQHRALLHHSLDELTEEEARRHLVPSATTLLGLLKHVVTVETVWFGEAVTGRHRTTYGVPADAALSFLLDDADTIASVQQAHREACERSRTAVAGRSLDEVLTGHSRFGPLTVRWAMLHTLRELAQHAGHADILREQVLAARS